jgi:membrane-associated phospholipid phosphatase
LPLRLAAAVPVSQQGMASAAVRLARAFLRVLRFAILVGCLYALAYLRRDVPVWAYFAVPAASVAVLYLVMGHERRFRWLALYIVGFATFVQVRTLADETGIPAQFSYPIVMESFLFLGATPTVWLQERLYSDEGLGAVDYASGLVYVSYFFAVHVTALVLFLRSSSNLAKFCIAVLATLWTGVAVCFILPTAPPWLASEVGQLDGITRIMPMVTGVFSGSAYETGNRIAGSNEVAAMPSLHMAVTVVIALLVCDASRRWGPIRYLAFAYPAAMAFVLVYLGEHYFVDAAAGAFVALGAWHLAARLTAARRPRVLATSSLPAKGALQSQEEHWRQAA